MTLAILVFNFYPVTAVMIVMLALLNDGAILSIAYDNVHYKDQPEAWNMRLVLGIATVLGVIGPIAAFGLFYLGDRVFNLGHPQLQTLMYLMLSVAGHLTIFLTRTRGRFWSIRPSRVLLVAVFGTQTVATLIAVFGIFMTPLGWGLALFVWVYALAWFLVNDQIKVLAYRILDPAKPQADATAEPKPKADATAEPKPKADATAGPKPEPTATATAGPKPEPTATAKPKADATAGPKPKADATAGPKPEPTATPKPKADATATPKPKADTTAPAKPDATAEPKPKADATAGPKPEPTATAKPDATAEPKPKPKPDATAEPKPESTATAKPKADATAGPKPEPTATAKPDATAEPKPKADATAGPKPEPTATATAGPKPGPKAETPSDLTPQLVKRVHEMYEELGREEVQAVEDMEKAGREVPKGGPDE
jgi:H+-transporting ATPase